MLPVWIALVAIGATQLGARCRRKHASLPSPRSSPPQRSPRTRSRSHARFRRERKRAVAAPAAWLATQLGRGDVLYPYSPVFFAALPAAKEARAYSREPVALARAVKRTGATQTVFISIPLREPLNGEALRRAGVRFQAFPSWLILESRGPFANGTAALESAAKLLKTATPIVTEPNAHAYAEQIRGTACDALVRLRSAC